METASEREKLAASVRENKIGLIKERERATVHVDSLPFFYHVHLFMPCNQKCIMCMPDGSHSREVLPFEDLVRFVEEIDPYAEHLTLIGGEPLLYPWIQETIDLLAERQIAVTINTNSTVLDEPLCNRLQRLHELHLKCSIDAMSRETYWRVRGTDAFERVTENMRRFAEATRESPAMKQVLVYVVMRENLHEVVPFVDYAKAFHPERIEFHPVRHVQNWVVENGTGWTFEGKEQSCEFFRDEYNHIMEQAAEKCEREGVEHEVLFL